jgi:hypothetical protein
VSGFRTKKNATPHVSQRCSTRINPFPATTWPTGSIASLWQAGHRRSRVSGSGASGGGMARHRSMGTAAVNVADPTQPMLRGVR